MSKHYEFWFYCPDFKMRKQGPYSCEYRNDLILTLRGEKSYLACQTHSGILMSKSNNVLGQLPIMIFEYSTSLVGCLGLLSLQESRGEFSAQFV